jgi:hypothetical protein
MAPTLRRSHVRYGSKADIALGPAMSPLPPKADIAHHDRDVRFVPKADIRRSFDHRRGRSPHWIKVKNPNAPAVKREAEEDWGRKLRRMPNET